MAGDSGDTSNQAASELPAGPDDDKEITKEQMLMISIGSLEQLLEDMPEIHVTQNQQGEDCLIERRTTEETLHRLYFLAVQLRGTIEDYVALGLSYLSLAQDEENPTEKHRLAYETFNKIPQDQHDESIIFYLMFSTLNIWLSTQQKPELEKAYQHAQRLFKEYAGLGAHYHHYAGRIYIEKAENDETLTLEDKINLFKQGTAYLREAVQQEQNEMTHYHLAEAIATYLDHCTDPTEKQQLKKEAIHHLTKAYELGKDPIVLDAIKEIEAA